MTIRINLDESFPHLNNPPIREAILEIRAIGRRSWQEEDLHHRLQVALSDYPVIKPRRASQVEVHFSPDTTVAHQSRDLGWQGFEVRTEDKMKLGRFEHNGFLFSWNMSYPGWQTFEREACRLWEIHRLLAEPEREVQRLGLRFINQIMLNDGKEAGAYFQMVPRNVNPLSTPQGFLHKDLFEVEGYNYVVQVIKVMQSRELILDIDVGTKQPFDDDCRPETLRRMLSEMRWLKNKVFLGLVTEDFMETFK